MYFHPFNEYIHLARGWNLISYIYYHFGEHSASNCTHTHTSLHISLHIPSRSREQTDNHCQNLHLAVNPCQDSSPSSMYLVTICWNVTRSDGTNKDNCWLNIEFWVFLQPCISSISNPHYFSLCSLFISQ